MDFDFRTQIFALIEQRRFAAAADHLAELIEAEPDDPGAHVLRGLCLAELDRLDEALESVRTAVRLDPESAYCRLVLASLLADRGELRSALAQARVAVRLDPDDPDPHVLAARVEAAQGSWEAALETTGRALALDPEHPGALRLRGLVLQQRGRAEEADSAFLNALLRDPEDAFAYAGRGWSMLHTGGEQGNAAAHFQEALRLDPQLPWAREGLITSLKAHNPVYRLMLRYFFWMGSLSPRTRMLIVVGGLLGYNTMRRLAAARPELAPVIWPLLGLYVAFVFLTWTADPLFDSLLRLDPVGRAALTRDRVTASNWVLLTVAAAAGLGLASWAADEPRLVGGAVVCAFLVLPVAGTFQCEPGWPRNAMAGLTALAALLGAGSVAAPEEQSALLFLVALLLIGVGTWLNRWLASVVPTRRSRPA